MNLVSYGVLWLLTICSMTGRACTATTIHSYLQGWEIWDDSSFPLWRVIWIISFECLWWVIYVSLPLFFLKVGGGLLFFFPPPWFSISNEIWHAFVMFGWSLVYSSVWFECCNFLHLFAEFDISKLVVWLLQLHVPPVKNYTLVMLFFIYNSLLFFFEYPCLCKFGISNSHDYTTSVSILFLRK